MLLIQKSWTNESKGYLMGESDKYEYESFTDNLKELFQSMQSEYGKCISACYIDLNGKPKKIGWVFEMKVNYENTNESYLHHTWISIEEKKGK